MLHSSTIGDPVKTSFLENLFFHLQQKTPVPQTLHNQAKCAAGEGNTATSSVGWDKGNAHCMQCRVVQKFTFLLHIWVGYVVLASSLAD